MRGGSRVPPDAAWWATAAVLAGLLALAHPTARPFHSNQNQYFSHAVGDRTAALAGDWLVGTADPYPLFTWFAGGVLDLAGPSGLRLSSFAVTATAILAVGFVASALTTVRSPWSALLTMVVGAISLSPAVVAGSVPTAFQGLAGQYVLFVPGYVQPSSVGVALVFTAGLLLRYADAEAGRRRGLLVAAAASAALACAIHPTYAVVVVLGLAAAAVVDLIGGETTRLRAYATVAVVGAAAALAANPSLVTLGTSLSDSSSLQRFAFERIPHHTLLTAWSWNEDWLVVLVIAAAAIAAPGVRHGSWLARWLALGLAGSLIAAGLVWGFAWTSLALAFPWRISVVLMPVSVAVLAVRCGDVVQRVISRRRRAVQVGLGVTMVALVASVVAGLGWQGLEMSRNARDPARSAPVSLVSAVAPEGVGLVPLMAEEVRLNAGYPVFVDWKSPPYASEDLDEWWRRVDAVRAVERDPELLCTAEWALRVDWILTPRSVEIPRCLQEWSVARGDGGWRLLVEP